MVTLLQVDRAADKIWTACAEAKGWNWVAAYGGYVHPNRPRAGTDGSQFDHFDSDVSAEDACFIEGIETLDQAKASLEDNLPPWRAVVSTTKLMGRSSRGSNRRLSAYNILECGHRFEVRGERALDAKCAKRRRCKECQEVSR